MKQKCLKRLEDAIVASNTKGNDPLTAALVEALEANKARSKSEIEI